MSSINELSRSLHKLVYGLDRIAEEVLKKKSGLTFSQFRILLVVEKYGNISQADIAKMYDLTAAAISRQIDILKKRRFVTSKQNASNKRQSQLGLTASGKKHITAAMKDLEQALTPLFNSMGKTEEQKLSSTLGKLVTAIHEKGVDYFCKS